MMPPTATNCIRCYNCVRIRMCLDTGLVPSRVEVAWMILEVLFETHDLIYI